ncbi:MAG: PEP-CTERM sorting domain-containing protein [Fimbriimonadaceae bacterium]|jgi:hypothetical protein|nr:PEP-CTERM sorting domain-containing protein [Fimbriimonadaceae bacterium]
MKRALLATLATLSIAAMSHGQIVLSNSALPGDSFTNAGGVNTGQAVGTSGWYYNNVRNSGVAGINNTYARSGNGSAYLETRGANVGNSKADIEYYLSPSTNFFGNYGLGLSSQSLGKLKDLTSLSYDWYRDGSSTNDAIQHPALRLYIVDPATFAMGYIVFERAYNGGGPAVPTNAWVSEDLFANRATVNMWATGSSLPGTGSNPNYGITLQTWMDSSANYDVFGISAGVGSGWGAFKGAVDNIGIGFNGNNNVNNFEVVPEPFTMIGLGLAALAAKRRRKAGKK